MSSLSLTPLSAPALGVVPDSVSSSAYALKTDVPTIEELVAGAQFFATISADVSYGCFIAPFACNVVQATLMTWSNTVSASDTNYWTVSVRRYRANTGANIAQKTTKSTGGEAISQRTDWNFDAVTFDTSNKVLAKGDGVGFAFEKTGTPDSVQNPFVQIRYEPV